jgi:hypothetical protein
MNTADTFIVTTTGFTPAGYNGTFLATVTGTNTFTFPLTPNPGVATVLGTYSPPGQGELIAMNNTFWGQGTGQAVYVLELGPNDGSTGPAALQSWIAGTPSFYSYLIPRNWDNTAGLFTLISLYEADNAQTYFYVTTTTATYTNYTSAMKCVQAWVEAPNLPLTEFDAAAALQINLNYAPSTTNRQTPFCYAFMYGVTNYPVSGNSALLASLQAANVNYVASSAQGGLTTSIVWGGTTLDGNDFTYWYSADWIQINASLNVANAVINGSNNPLNPLYYDQNGINVLQDVVVQTVGNAISFGLATGQVARTQLDGVTFAANLNAGDYTDQDVVNAVPFVTYTTENPSDYPDGIYKGLSVVYIPNRGFKQIFFNILVTSFISQ